MSEPTPSVRDLKAEAKWAPDLETQKESIEELSSHGKKAIPALEEVKAVTAQDEIRQEVEAAIKGIKNTNATTKGRASRSKKARKPSAGKRRAKKSAKKKS
jgi:hypothetical protein